MNILIIGSGGREHALAWKANQSQHVKHVWVAPGNAGTALEPNTSNIDIAVTDIPQLVDFAKKHTIDLTIIGPETALAAGIVDAFQAAKLPCFGPTQAAAQLETSKSFCKHFMQQHHIPTASYATFDDKQTALNYLSQQAYPLVIKADGLAAGKGVIIAATLAEAEQAIRMMFDEQAFGDAGNRIVIEAFLSGEELSYIVMVDGEHILPLASSQDHKRLRDGDLGPNTGGMGAYSPSPLLTPALEQTILNTVIQPTVTALKQQGTPYTGFLYAGLMIDTAGQIKVLEFNCRMGDPETQPILMRLQSDLITLCLAALDQRLDQIDIHWDPRPALTVVMAAGDYPTHYSKGDPIKGLDQPLPEHSKIFHAGTALKKQQITTNGGRILAVTSLADTLKQAQQQAYQTVQTIHWDHCYFRTDIGHRALKT